LKTEKRVPAKQKIAGILLFSMLSKKWENRMSAQCGQTREFVLLQSRYKLMQFIDFKNSSVLYSGCKTENLQAESRGRYG